MICSNKRKPMELFNETESSSPSSSKNKCLQPSSNRLTVQISSRFNTKDRNFPSTFSNTIHKELYLSNFLLLLVTASKGTNSGEDADTYTSILSIGMRMVRDAEDQGCEPLEVFTG
ncbi:hypothetical protein TNIN_500861 [Trichonephila inaurata madagascariensis]|uniref:Uncharacterized protein n=1 Tax=Trichonephila inaurata madagascariensis TaxID=2747483 RepID=A0A8X6YNI9_9ARAC|nr:hypothetical protein TNIN_500861 [Trichonephila inaurata madagascariensis]